MPSPSAGVCRVTVTPWMRLSASSALRIAGIFAMELAPRTETIRRFPRSNPSGWFCTWCICAIISSVTAIAAAEMVNCTSTRNSRMCRLPLPTDCLPVSAVTGAHEER